MKTTAFLPAIMIVAMLALIVVLNLKRRSKDQQHEREGKPPRGIPKIILAFWVLLGIAVIVLLIWSPKK